MEEEEESSYPCVECEVPRELLLYTNQLMPPLAIGFERFEVNELDLCCTAMYCNILYITNIYNKHRFTNNITDIKIQTYTLGDDALVRNWD